MELIPHVSQGRIDLVTGIESGAKRIYQYALGGVLGIIGNGKSKLPDSRSEGRRLVASKQHEARDRDRRERERESRRRLSCSFEGKEGDVCVLSFNFFFLQDQDGFSRNLDRVTV